MPAPRVAAAVPMAAYVATRALHCAHAGRGTRTTDFVRTMALPMRCDDINYECCVMGGDQKLESEYPREL